MEKFFLSVTGLISLWFIFCILSGTENLFVHQEYYEFFLQCAFSESINFQIDDLKAFFNVCFDNASSRPRFYSWFFWLLDIRFRTILFDFLPFHPTVSLTWIFTFTLLPFYFFKLMKNLNCSTNISIASTFLLLCSQGVLSSLTMYFHSAKPMTLVFLVMNLYMASLMQNKCLNQEKIGYIFYFKWFFLLLISLFWDEIFYIFFLITPWIFRKSVFSKKIIDPFMVINFLLFFVFVVTNQVIVPHYSKVFYNRDYSFLATFHKQVSFSGFSLEHIKYNAMSLIDSHMNFTSSVPGYYWTQTGVLYQIIFTFIVLMIILRRKKMNPHVFSITISFMIFFLFQQLVLLGRSGKLIYGSFYWGAPFSILFSIWIGLLLSSLNLRLKYLAYPIIVILCLANYRHTVAAAWGHSNKTHYCNKKITQYELVLDRNVAKYPYRLIYDVWKHKDNVDKVKKLLYGKPCNSSWLFHEVKLYEALQIKQLE